MASQLHPGRRLRVEEMQKTPSRKDMISEEIERGMILFGCQLIQDASVLLELPQTCISTAQNFLKRFFLANSMKAFDIRYTAFSSLFLAGKVEEIDLRPSTVITVMHHLLSRRKVQEVLSGGETPVVSIAEWRERFPIQGPKSKSSSSSSSAEGGGDQLATGEGSEKRYSTSIMGFDETPLQKGSDAYWNFKEVLLFYERHVLRSIGFQMTVDHCHKYLLIYSNALKLPPPIIQLAFNFANDLQMGFVSLRFNPSTLACSCLLLSCVQLAYDLSSSHLPVDWWLLFDVSYEDMLEVLGDLHILYRTPPVFINLSETTGLTPQQRPPSSLPS